MQGLNYNIRNIHSRLSEAFFFALRFAISFVFSYFSSRCSIFEGVSPFSTILLTVSSKIGLSSTFCYLGGTFGMLSKPFDLAIFKYITSMTLLYIMQVVFRKAVDKSTTEFFFTAGLSTFICGILFMIVERITLFHVLALAAECILIFCSAYFITFTTKAFKSHTVFSSQEFIAATITVTLILLTLKDCFILNLNAARVVSLLILFLAISILKTSHIALLGTCFGVIHAAFGNGGETIFSAFIIGTLGSCVAMQISEKLAAPTMTIFYYGVLLFYGKFPWNYWLFAEPLLSYAISFIIPKESLRNKIEAFIEVRYTPKNESSKTQDEDMGLLIEQFTSSAKKLELKIESNIEEINFLSEEEIQIGNALSEKGVFVKDISFTNNKQNIKQCIITFYTLKNIEIETTLKDVFSAYFAGHFSIKIDNLREEYTATLKDISNYSLSCAALSKSKPGEDRCGDSATGFSLGSERHFLILSDGMGSGKNAALSSEETIRTVRHLITGGLSIHGALNVFRSVSSFYEGDSFSTLDICSVDLNRGIAEFYKAGSYHSYILRDDLIITVPGGGLPLALEGNSSVFQQNILLSDGDYIIMVSDGVAPFNFEEILISEMDCNPNQYARKILRRIYETNIPINDDITVLVCRIIANE